LQRAAARNKLGDRCPASGIDTLQSVTDIQPSKSSSESRTGARYSRDMPSRGLTPNTAKSAELQIIIWLLEAGWELFTPVADLYGTDIVVRHPATRELLAIQVKHKQHGSLNEGELLKTWGDCPSFDYLVFFVPARARGLILPCKKLVKPGKMFIFYSKDSDGYSRGAVRKLFKDYAFEFGAVPPERRAAAFAEFLSAVHVLNKSDRETK